MLCWWVDKFVAVVMVNSGDGGVSSVLMIPSERTGNAICCAKTANLWLTTNSGLAHMLRGQGSMPPDNIRQWDADMERFSSSAPREAISWSVSLVIVDSRRINYSGHNLYWTHPELHPITLSIPLSMVSWWISHCLSKIHSTNILGHSHPHTSRWIYDGMASPARAPPVVPRFFSCTGKV